MKQSILVAGVLFLCGISAAQAIPITASFTGRGDVEVIDFIPGDGILDEPLLDIPISGTLAFDTELGPDVQPQPIDDGVELLFQSFVLTFTFELLAELGPQTFTFESVPLVTLRDDGTSQGISFSTLEFFEAATLDLRAMDGSLFSNFDLSTFNPAAIDPALSTARFNLPRFLGGMMQLEQIRFEGAGVGVAEPPLLALLLAGLPALLLGLRRRRALPAR